MATLCKNCGSGLECDPKTQKLICKFCGSSFYAEEVEALFKPILEGAGYSYDEEYECYENEAGNQVSFAQDEDGNATSILFWEA